MKNTPYYVYILRCSDDTLYTGLALDVDVRLYEHNYSKKGAKYTKIRRPLTLVYKEKLENRSAAASREYAIKKLSRKEKLELINSKNLS